VHGFTSGFAGTGNARVGANLRYNSDGGIVYSAAALGIILENNNKKNNSSKQQCYFEGHDDDILCLAVSSDRNYIATGQTASKTSKGKGTVYYHFFFSSYLS
jgi:microtubule-associated protein-like 6